MALSVAVTVITYKRPQQLSRLLDSLQCQSLDEGYTCRIVVVDNDPDATAHSVIKQASGAHPIQFFVEADPGIPAARRACVELTLGDDLVVFIDDDEVAPSGWLQRLIETHRRTGADVVTGPVRGILAEQAPRWAKHSDVYSSVGKHPTGARLTKAYTNNTLVTRAVLDSVKPSFHDAFRFTGSSDLHYFLRVSKAGFRIVWDDDAVVEESVPASRLTLGWLTRRAFRSGAGDAISRRLISPGLRTLPLVAALGLARIGNGFALLALGLLNPARRIKGYRRVISGVGTLAGIAGVNHEEYQRLGDNLSNQQMGHP